MRSKRRTLTNFSNARSSQSFCVRPDNEEQLTDYLAHYSQKNLLVRGSGLSYNDSCFNTDGVIINTERLNHFIHFDDESGIVICQGGVTLKDLFLVHPDFIPPVIPGTVHATVAGCIAHDVHGKNNHRAGSFGHHLVGFDLLIGSKKYACSPNQNSELFYATIAGLGLTGVITRAAIRLKKMPRFVQAYHQQFDSLQTLTENMSTLGIQHDYQVAWLDLLHPVPRAILSIADHCEPFMNKDSRILSVPKIPFPVIKEWNLKIFNHYFFTKKKGHEKLSLQQFNNPLDRLLHWNRFYGAKGLIQFQALFNETDALSTIEQLISLIRAHKATPTLAVLKLFTQSGKGLLSFCKPGFTLAIDFINNAEAQKAITAMNQFIADINARIYLAKDIFLNEQQFKYMYEQQDQFCDLLKQYQCNMNSDLARRLGIKK
ncbi:oxidoreductase [Legionella wadsworthii]|uniref:Oxidoreductase n=1 Tax=Legionella wadsworthii TaxID=28088 RepID=A0A378LQE4_9GAMM|nr:FAD-binding oxidoreductase [Legionella wadsworthii]STY28994.1 oxidoreductase [Legionella wadsworthii]